MTTKFITLDVWNTEDIKVKVNQGEVNARFLEVQFIDKNQPLNLEDKRVFFFAKKPDGNLIFNRCEIVDENDGKINLALTSQMSIVDGIMQDCEVDIIATDLARLKVKGLILEIEKCTDFDSATESTSEFTALEEAITGYEGASDTINAHVANKNNPHEVTTAQIGAVPYEVKYNADFDDMTTPGFYTMINGDNSPTYIGNFSLIVNKADTNDRVQQIAVSENWGEVYLRQYEEFGFWSPWASFSMDSHRHAASHITSGTLPIARGGTNATSASTALSNLGGVPTTRTINSKALSSNITLSASDVGAAESNHTHSTSDITSGTLPIARGGTNATSASTALSNLGGVPTTRTINSKALSSNITLNASDVGAAPYEVKFEEDFNNMKTPGLYTMVMCDNSPPGGTSHSLLVNKSYDEGDFVQQIAIEESTYDVYMRYCSNTSWSNWKLFSMGGHSHSISDITSGTLPINMGGTGATVASDALSNLGGVNFSNIVQQTIYVPERPKIPSKGFNIVSFTNPFRGNTTDKILGVTSCHISGRPTAEGTGTSYSMHLVAEPQFSSSNAVGYILIYNPNTSDLYVTSDSYIVVSSVKP